MLLVRGSLSDVEADAAATRRLADHVEATGEPALRVWTPPRQVAFGRRDAAADGYERAREAARAQGYEPVERRVGGRAVAYTGETVAFANVTPTDDERAGIQRRYREATDLLEGAFRDLGVSVRRGEPDDSFCPGDHSLQVGFHQGGSRQGDTGQGGSLQGAGKIAGLAQRVRRETALVGGCVIARERDETDVPAVLEPVYDALGVPFDPESVGSVEGAGGPGDVEVVVDAIESGVVGGRGTDVVAAADLAGDAP